MCVREREREGKGKRTCRVFVMLRKRSRLATQIPAKMFRLLLQHILNTRVNICSRARVRVRVYARLCERVIERKTIMKL